MVDGEMEPGIAGVPIKMVNNDRERSDVEPLGGGSTAHTIQRTGEDGIARFLSVPKDRNFRFRKSFLFSLPSHYVEE